MAEFVTQEHVTATHVPQLRMSVVDRMRNNGDNRALASPYESPSGSSSELSGDSPQQRSVQPLQPLNEISESPKPQISALQPELPMAPLTVTFEELPRSPRPARPTRPTRPKPVRTRSLFWCCSTLNVLDACCITIDRIVEALDACGYCVVTSLAYSCLICCSQRVMMAGVHPRQVTEQDMRDQEIDYCLDTCCCGVCRIPRWWCAYCCCICDEVENGLVHPYQCTSDLRQLFQRLILVLCIFATFGVVYLAVVAVIGVSVTCSTGRCVFG